MNAKILSIASSLFVLCMLFGPGRTVAEEFCNFDGCADFPAGAVSFADFVVDYSPPVGNFLHPLVMGEDDALGIPDTDLANLNDCAMQIACNFLSLGHGGSVTLRFDDNVLTGSNDDSPDLFIFETGPITQGMSVEISRDGSTWIPVGSVAGDVSSVDIDAFGFTKSDAFRYVKLIDDNTITPDEQDESVIVAGADIDAVGTISGASRAGHLLRHYLSFVNNLTGIDYLARVSSVVGALLVDYHDIDVLSGTGGRSLRYFPTEMQVIDTAAVPLIGADERQHVAVLVVDPITGLVYVKVKDWLTGDLVALVSFDLNVTPRWLRVIPDTGNDGSPDIVVVGIGAGGRPRAQIKDALTGALVARVDFDPEFVPFAFAVLGNIGAGSAPELALFGVNALGQVRSQIKDVVTGNLEGMVWFDPTATPLMGVGVDTNGDGFNDALAVLASLPNGDLRAQVKVGATAALAGIVYFDRGSGPMRMVGLPSHSGLGAALAVLQRDPTGFVRAQVKLIATGALIQRIPFRTESTPMDLIGTPDIDGSGFMELAYYGMDPLGGSFLQVKDIVSGDLVYREDLPE